MKTRLNLSEFQKLFEIYRKNNDEALDEMRKRINYLEEKLGYKYEPDNKIQRINNAEMSMIRGPHAE